MLSNITPIKGFESLYGVDELGNVYSFHYHGKPNKLQKLKASEDHHGYMVVNLFDGKIARKHRIHRLISITLIPNPDNKPQVNHINGNRHDNRVENLEWATSSENIKHAYRVLKRRHAQTGICGAKHHSSKRYTIKQNGIVIASLNGMQEVADRLRITRSQAYFALKKNKVINNHTIELLHAK